MDQKRRQTATKSTTIVKIWDTLEEIALFQTNKSIYLFNSGENKKEEKVEDVLIIKTNLMHSHAYQIKFISLQS